MSGAEARQHPHPWAEHGAGAGTYPKCAPLCCLPPLFILLRYKQCPESNDTTRHVHVTRGYLGSLNVVSVRLEKSWFVVLTVGLEVYQGKVVFGETMRSPATQGLFPPPALAASCHATLGPEKLCSACQGAHKPHSSTSLVYFYLLDSYSQLMNRWRPARGCMLMSRNIPTVKCAGRSGGRDCLQSPLQRQGEATRTRVSQWIF